MMKRMRRRSMGKKKVQKELKIYMAGPLFTAAERLFNAELAHRLRRAGFAVWLPQERTSRSWGDLFDHALAGISWCDVVLACMDGPDPDSGTCGECGHAYLKRPIVAYRTDVREGGDAGAEGPGYNLMLMGLASLNVRMVLSDPFSTDTAMAALSGQLVDVLRGSALGEMIARSRSRKVALRDKIKIINSSLYGKMGTTRPEGRKGRS